MSERRWHWSHDGQCCTNCCLSDDTGRGLHNIDPGDDYANLRMIADALNEREELAGKLGRLRELASGWMKHGDPSSVGRWTAKGQLRACGRIVSDIIKRAES